MYYYVDRIFMARKIILLFFILASILIPFWHDFSLAGRAEAKKLEVDGYALENYKKLKSKDIVLRVEKGTVYVMVGRNRWDAAKNNLKLITGDKLKVIPGTIAVINFYDEFDINLPESELTTIEPAGITQLINEALFRTTYKDGTYISEAVYEPSKLAQYKFRGAIQNRDLKLEYSKNKIEKKSNAVLIEDAHRQREKNKALRDRVMQAKNFGNGFTFNYENAEKKINNDNRIFSFEREKQMVEREIYSKMSAAAVLQKIIVSRKAAGVSAAVEEAQLNDLNNLLRGYTQKLEYINVTLRAFNEEQNKLKLKPKTKEW